MALTRLGLRHIQAWRPSKTFRRLESTYQPPTASKPNRHRGFYKEFGPPVIKNFLIALCTFQAIYWSWLKMESIEMKKSGDSEVRVLEGELKLLTKDKSGP
jgi:hypothetical protein